MYLFIVNRALCMETKPIPENNLNRTVSLVAQYTDPLLNICFSIIIAGSNSVISSYSYVVIQSLNQSGFTL